MGRIAQTRMIRAAGHHRRTARPARLLIHAVPPPIPLQFFGFASRPGEPQRIFLRTTDTNDVFVAGVGEVVNRRYRVLRIMGSGVEVEDVLNNNKQVLPLQQGG